jgi:hypothetical protein
MSKRKLVLPAAIAAGLIVAGGHAVSAGTATHTSGEIVAPVIKGVQIYKCTQQPDGNFAFTQYGVSAVLKFDIAHSFVQPTTGPPQWVAPDRSAVTGTVVSRTDNGPGNIPLLELSATQTGAPRGLLSRTVRILRLNTKGGVAPAGSCTPGAFAKVPYKADYHFLSK